MLQANTSISQALAFKPTQRVNLSIQVSGWMNTNMVGEVPTKDSELFKGD